MAGPGFLGDAYNNRIGLNPDHYAQYLPGARKSSPFDIQINAAIGRLNPNK